MSRNTHPGNPFYAIAKMLKPKHNGRKKKSFWQWYDKGVIIGLLMVSSAMSGFYFGVITDDDRQPVSHATPTLDNTPLITKPEPTYSDTTDTEIVSVNDFSGNKIFKFEGRSINETAKVEGFECRINFGEFMNCKSPFTMFDLTGTEYTFEVRAVDTNGNTDNTPAVQIIK